MDVDIQDAPQEAQSQEIETRSKAASGKKPTVFPVDDAHPFDLDSYISAYSDRTSIHRLFHVMQLAPSLAPTAYARAVEKIQSGRDTNFFATAVQIYNQHLGADNQVSVDSDWVESMDGQNALEKNKLEVELKTYQSNMIKESIRMAHRDLGNFYRSTGDDSASLKHYTKSREFCTASQHVLDMCISVLELMIEQRNYSHIATYVFKAEAALDVASTTGGAAAPGIVAPASLLHKDASAQKKTASSAERDKVQTKLEFATALSHLGQASYEKAASAFVNLGAPKGLGDWNGKIVSPGDIAVYGVLCSLATKSRSAIKASIMESKTFGAYLEYEPYVRDLVDAYMASRFKRVLDILDQYSSRHYLDVHLFTHVHDLTNLIRDRALALYFKPFASIKLERMALAFGLEPENIEKLIIGLIKSGDIQGRIDSRNKILKAKVVDQRIALFARAAEAGKQMEATDRKMLLRMRLQQADLVVKAPKSQNNPGPMIMGGLEPMLIGD